MVMWCLSGIVMMYVRYPSLSEMQRQAALRPIDWRGCCIVGGAVDARLAVRRMEIEMLAGQPVMRIAQGDGPARLINLTNGAPIDHVTADQARSVAAAFGAKSTAMHRIDHDQWTVSGEFRRDRPLYRFDLGDAARTRLYVSSTTGKAVQIATGSQRFWNWLGAVPHWLYFTRLRADPGVWSQVVIWTSLTGCFLTITGLYLGIRQLRRAPEGRWSPYRGFMFWHHLSGLAGGLFALSWVASGLISMNPWGFLDSEAPDTAQLQGNLPSGANVVTAISALAEAKPADGVSIGLVPFDGTLAFIAIAKDGTRRRLDMSGRSLPPPDMARAAVLLGGSSVELLDKGDAYYFNRGSPSAPLPVYRVVAGNIRYYLDPLSGAVLRPFDGDDRWFRWLHDGLHRLDFTPALRNGAFRTLVMLPLMLGVTLICGTGTWLAIRRFNRPRRLSSRGCRWSDSG
jgi:hypothetical protein